MCNSCQPKISIVLSFRNEADCIPELVRRLRLVMAREAISGHISGYEIIFVNDSSTDGSKAIITRIAKGHEDIRLINMSRPFGVSPCVMAGLERSSGDGVIYMDCDLQDPPEVIPDMLSVWRNHPELDVINTVRTKREGESLVKLCMTWSGYTVLGVLTGARREVGDFKLLSRRVVDVLVQMKEKDPFMRNLVQWVGFGQTYVPYVRRGRASGKTKFSICSSKVIRNFLESAIMSGSTAPMWAVIKLGVPLSMLLPAGIWLGVWALVLGALGINLTCFGLLAIHGNTILNEVRRRPNYIVESSYGWPK